MIALIVNFTGLTGHFGMLGTSLAIVEQLLAKGYDLVFIGVDELRAAVNGSAVEMTLFIDRVEQADLIFVNGEGTLHGWRPSSIALLSFIQGALKFSPAKLQVGNFSCFPNSVDLNPCQHDAKYKEVLHAVSERGQIVVRDQFSSRIMDRLGISHHVGFDSLPLVAEVHFKAYRHSDGNRIVVSGGAGMRPASLQRLAVVLESNYGDECEMLYISGGTDAYVQADQKQFEIMATVVPRLRFVRALNMREFMSVISQGVRLMATGRFHYAIAARCVGTPCVAWRSNTPKTEAISDQIGLLGVLSDANFDYRHARTVLQKCLEATSSNLRAIQELGQMNYRSIPVVSTAPRFSPSTLEAYGRLLRLAGVGQ